MSKDEDFSLEEKLAAMEMSLAEKKGARFDDLKRNLTETIVVRRRAAAVARWGPGGACVGTEHETAAPFPPGAPGFRVCRGSNEAGRQTGCNSR